MTKKTISLLTLEVKSRKLTGVSRAGMEETLKSLHIGAKMLIRKTNAMWNILLANENKAMTLADSILTTKSVRIQTECMGTHRTRITLHGVSMDITIWTIWGLSLPGMSKLRMSHRQGAKWVLPPGILSCR